MLFCRTVAAGSKLHVELAQKAKRLIVINVCANKCTSKILEQSCIRPTFEFTVVEKVPTFDFDKADVERIADEIATAIEAKIK